MTISVTTTAPTISFPPICIRASGPPNAKMMLVGEAPGASEEKQGLPFVGSSGDELSRMLSEAGLHRTELYLTNVFHRRPPNNNLALFTIDSKETKSIGNSGLPPLRVEGRVRHLHPALLAEVQRLWQEVETVRPNLIVAMGNTALWALAGHSKISAMRGTVLSVHPPQACLGIGQTTTGAGYKCLPTYHPAAVLRQWDLRPIVLADLMKAARQQQFPEVRRPERHILINPTFHEVAEFFFNLNHYDLLAVDIETARGQISEIGFAPSPSRALTIPFIKGFNDHYWSEHEEITVLRMVGTILSGSNPKVFQNGLYDLQYLSRYGFHVRNALHDTMLKHHSLYPEMQKGLGFLGSIYTDEPAWKLLRTRGQTEEKADDE